MSDEAEVNVSPAVHFERVRKRQRAGALQALAECRCRLVMIQDREGRRVAVPIIRDRSVRSLPPKPGRTRLRPSPDQTVDMGRSRSLALPLTTSRPLWARQRLGSAFARLRLDTLRVLLHRFVRPPSASGCSMSRRTPRTSPPCRRKGGEPGGPVCRRPHNQGPQHAVPPVKTR